MMQLVVTFPVEQEMSMRQLGRSIARDWPGCVVVLGDRYDPKPWEQLFPAAVVPEPGYTGRHRKAV